MNRLKLKHALFCCLILTLSLSAMSTTAVADEEPLAIDAGHSWAHPGSTSATGEPEFMFNSALAQTVSDFLTAHGNSVLRIGHDGKMDNLKKRTAIANQGGAKFFLSLHHDSVQPRYLKDWQWQGVTHQYSDYAAGFSLFVSRKNPYSQASLHCASAIGGLLREKGLHPTPHHAENIQGENREWADKENGVYFYDDLIVLKTAAMPAVLLEAGVIVNKEEELAVQQPERRNTIATAIENGLRNCGIINQK